MKKKKHLCFLFTLILAMVVSVCPALVKAQTNLSFDLRVEFEPVDGLNNSHDSVRCVITTDDVNNIASVHVKISRSDSSHVVLQHNFLFDSNTSLPLGTRWTRNGNEITILGYLPTKVYDFEVSLEDKNHNLSPIKYFFR